MKTAYLSGPMRGRPNFNYDSFHAAAKKLRANGWEVISPAEQDLKHGFDPSILNGKDGFSNEEVREFARRDCQIIIEELRAENGDAVAVLSEWEGSVGATAEVALGKWCRLRIIDSETEEDIQC